MESAKESRLSPLQGTLLVVLRVAIGWHMLYEGWYKLTEPGGWSAAGYLRALPAGPLSGVFHAIPNHPDLLRVVDLLNMWGLTAVGLGLIVGFLTPYACLGGMLMLAMYYLGNPPWISVRTVAGEGNYLYLDKNLLELIALGVVLAFNTGRLAGLDVLVHRWRELRKAAPRPRAARKKKQQELPNHADA